MKSIYVAGPMRGIPEFNFPAFAAATEKLRAEGHTVFSPAERDIQRHGGVDVSKGNAEGSEEIAAKEHGFNLRQALADDTEWICKNATAIALLPGWQESKGACAEKALGEALGLEIIFLEDADWIDHNGGEQPVGDDVIVDVRFRDGGLCERRPADTWIWRWSDGDIVAYKVRL